MVKVLSIDGGGIWGYVVAKIIAQYEYETGKKFCDNFVAFAGTSTGAIIASLLAEGYSGVEIYEFYKSYYKMIFKKWPWYKRFNPNLPKYDNSYLGKLLKEKLKGNMTDFTKPVYIPVSRSSKPKEKVFDNTDNFPKWLAVLASTSAPTYFKPVYVKETKEYLMDGGLWANNPSDVLQAGLKELFDDNYKMLSFNTGGSGKNKDLESMNLINWASYIMGEWVTGSGEGSSYRTKKNIGSENYMRIEPMLLGSDFEIEMDTIDRIEDLEKIAERTFNSYYKKIKRFMEQ